MTEPQINPGEIANWPLLKIVYRTDHDKIADLLPPGIEPSGEPNVHVNIYNVPVKGEPEYGVSTKIPARYEGVPGYYGIGLGIDQESAIFISQELNGQPKFPCSIVYFRRDDAVTLAEERGRAGELRLAVDLLADEDRRLLVDADPDAVETCLLYTSPSPRD